jgi:RIO kinase 1
MSSDYFLNEKNNKKIDKKIQLMIRKSGFDRKTQDEVFDKSTLLSLEKLISNRVIDTIDFPISTGKEGNVFRATTPDRKYFAVKIYRTSTSTFKHISNYLIGDPRFKSLKKNRRNIIYTWTKKEYLNLEKLSKIGIKVPKPIEKINNILVMNYIGDFNKPAPLLINVKIKNPNKIYQQIIKSIIKMYNKADLVHCDMSAYNILIYKNDPYIIDLGQALLTEHPKSNEYLKRDIHNIVNYFNNYGIKSDENKIYKKIIKK